MRYYSSIKSNHAELSKRNTSFAVGLDRRDLKSPLQALPLKRVTGRLYAPFALGQVSHDCELRFVDGSNGNNGNKGNGKRLRCLGTISVPCCAA